MTPGPSASTGPSEQGVHFRPVGPTSAAAFTLDEFRDTMGLFVTGVAVVTMCDEGGPHGTTVNSFTSLSLDPALVLVCLVNSSRSTRVIRHSGAFAVNILSHEQVDVGRRFGNHRVQGDESFEGVPYRSGLTGAPLLVGAVAQIDCRLFATVPAGDHTIFIGEVLDLGAAADNPPLAFHRGRFLPLAA